MHDCQRPLYLLASLSLSNKDSSAAKMYVNVEQCGIWRMLLYVTKLSGRGSGRAPGDGDVVGEAILGATEKFAPEPLKRGDDGATKAASDAIKEFFNLGDGN